MINITMRCQHRCSHCYVDFRRGNVIDMPDSVLEAILDKAADAGILKNVSLLGGEPFFDPYRLIRIVDRIWHKNAGTLEIFIPTNGRWIVRGDWETIVAEIVQRSQWFPYGLRIAFSHNKWNMEQLRDYAPIVWERWQLLEKAYPDVFYHREIQEEGLLPLGRAAKNSLSRPDETVGVNCSFDDWYDPVSGGGFYTDYLSFFPNGDCGLCYVYHSPVIGTYQDDFSDLLALRRQYLIDFRIKMTGDECGILYPDACVKCKNAFSDWLVAQKKT